MSDTRLAEQVSIGGDGIRVVHPLFQAEGDGAIPISPLQLEVGRIRYDLAARLNELWHSRFPIVPKPETHAPCYAAHFAGRYYAVALWGRPNASNRMRDGERKLELKRFAIAPDAPRNTASRMLRVMRALIRSQYPHIIGLLSYQDTGAHAGTIYRAAGWSAAAESHSTSWKRQGSRRHRDEFVQSDSPKVRWEIAA